MNKIFSALLFTALVASCTAYPAFAQDDNESGNPDNKCFTLEQVKVINAKGEFKYIKLPDDVAKTVLDSIEKLNHPYPEREKAVTYYVAESDQDELSGAVWLQGYKADGCLAAMEMMPKTIFEQLVGKDS